MTNSTTISVPTKNDVDTKSQVIFDDMKAQMGMVPNLYATIGYSSNALESFMAFSGNAGKDTFNKKEIEAIKLAVSEANNCDYCKAAHTAIAKMNGFSQEETVQLRNATIADSKLQILSKISGAIAKKAGHIDPSLTQSFFDLGYDEKALIDLVAVITSVTFTNYVHGITKVAVDFPAV